MIKSILASALSIGGSIMGGLWGYLITAALGAVGATLITWHFVHVNNAVEISGLKTQIAETRAASIAASLEQLQNFINNMHNQANDYGNYRADLNKRFDALQVEFKNAIRIPLPKDCKPTADRVRSLHNAITNANTH